MAVDTSTMRLGIGIRTSSGESFSRRWSEEGHSAPLFGRIEFTMKQLGLGLGDIELLGIISGPGSFTGLRIGMAGLLGWGVSAGLPIQTVDSFAAMRASVPESMYPLLIAIHSRGDDFYMKYIGSADAGDDAEPFMGSVDSLNDLPAGRCAVCGPGTEKLLALLGGGGSDKFDPAQGDYHEPNMKAACELAERLFRSRDTGRDNYTVEPYYMTLSQAQIRFENRGRRI